MDAMLLVTSVAQYLCSGAQYFGAVEQVRLVRLWLQQIDARGGCGSLLLWRVRLAVAGVHRHSGT